MTHLTRLDHLIDPCWNSCLASKYKHVPTHRHTNTDTKGTHSWHRNKHFARCLIPFLNHTMILEKNVTYLRYVLLRHDFFGLQMITIYHNIWDLFGAGFHCGIPPISSSGLKLAEFGLGGWSSFRCLGQHFKNDIYDIERHREKHLS